MKIGVLDIHGSVGEHAEALRKVPAFAGATCASTEVVFVKKPSDLDGVSGLIIPGGESTTMGKLLRRFGLREAILKRVEDGLAIWGTCAGAILLAKKISGLQGAESLELMDIEIERNAYGRQLDSFEAEIEFVNQRIPAVFIRAPKILKVGGDVEILSKYRGEIVATKDGQFLATTFHPELTEDVFVHRYFLEMCE